MAAILFRTWFAFIKLGVTQNGTNFLICNRYLFLLLLRMTLIYICKGKVH
jgi:hypothetical protein